MCNRSFSKITSLLLANGFPQYIIDGVKQNVINMDSNTKRQKPDNPVYLSLPFLTDSLKEICTDIVKKCGINNILLSWKPGRSLKSQLVSSQFSPQKCHKGCMSCAKTAKGYFTKCDTRMFVYELKCSICGDTYIGQSSRFPHNRIYEHCRSVNNLEDDKAISTHFLENHSNDDISLFDFTFRILKSCNDYLDMLISESELIKKYEPKINIYVGKWKLLN